MRTLALVFVSTLLVACTSNTAPETKESPKPTPAPPTEGASQPEPPKSAMPANGFFSAPDEVEPVTPPGPIPVAPAQDDEPSDDDDAFDFLAGEAIGELQLGLTAEKATALLGKPGETGPIEFEGANAVYRQSWHYRDVGVHLDMTAETRGGPQSLASIHIDAPSKLRTKRDIGIGSSRAEVEKAYGDVRDEESSEPEKFIAGSIYGGLFFEFEGDVVRSIFMGAGAE